MFTILVDDELLYHPLLKDAGLIVFDPKLSLELNKAGSLEFTMPKSNPMYDSINKLKSIVTVYRDNELMFRGRVLNDQVDIYLNKQVYCEGDLSFLLDSQLRPMTFTGGLASYFTTVINNHNDVVTAEKRFTVGQITLSEDPDDETAFFDRSSTDYTDSLNAISSNILETNGGFVRTRTVGNTHYIDLLADYTDTCSQTIEFGKNLLDITKYINAEDVYTVVIPLGKEIENEEGEVIGRVDISSINDGKDYVEDDDAIALFGRIERVIVYDEITSKNTLKKKGNKALKKGISQAISLDISAVDLHMVDVDYQAINLGYRVEVISTMHNVDREFLCTKIDYDLVDPSQTQYGFSTEYKESSSLSDRQHDQEKDWEEERERFSTMLEEAKKRASDLINAGLSGYVYKTREELYIMDTDDINTATKVWRWNLGGLGYWSGSPGGALTGTYNVAMTQDGAIVADFITVGMLNAERVQFGDKNAFDEFLDLIQKDEDLHDEIQNNVIAVDVQYYRSSSNTERKPFKPGDGWQTTSPIWEEGCYIWSRQRRESKSGEVHYSNPVCITGNPGEKGTGGVGVKSITELYCVAASKPEKPTVKVVNEKSCPPWQLDMPSASTNLYYYTCSQILYDNGVYGWSDVVKATPFKEIQDKMDDLGEDIDEKLDELAEEDKKRDGRMDELEEEIDEIIEEDGKKMTKLESEMEAVRELLDRMDSDLSGYRSSITNDPSTGELVIQYANPSTQKVSEIRMDGSMIKFYVDGSEQLKAYISADGFVFERGILTDSLTIGTHWMWSESKNGSFRLVRVTDE